MIAWLDIETTGLDPDRDFLLEVGVVVTDDNLDVIAQRAVVVGYPDSSLQPDGIVGSRLDLNDGFTMRMHTDSGLLTAVRLSQHDRWSAEMILVDFMKAVSFPDKLVMGGSSITFDRRFLARSMPELLAMFHYRSIDVSTIRELARRWCPDLTAHEPVGRGTHRSIPDIEDSIELARYYREHIFITIPPSKENSQ